MLDLKIARLLMLLSLALVLLMACAQRTPPLKSTWQYIAIGDSFTGTNYWPEIYTSYIEQDLGVEVELRVRWNPNMNHDRMLELIRSDQELREMVRNAEVITISYDPGTLDAPEAEYLRGSCGGADNQDCLRDGVEKAQQDWDSILDEIVDLRNPSEALIRTFMIGPWPYPVFYGKRASPEELQVLIGYFLELNAFVGESASQHGIPVIDVGEALMGPGYAKTIPDKYMASDHLHFSEEGGELVAGLLRDLGYERSSP